MLDVLACSHDGRGWRRMPDPQVQGAPNCPGCCPVLTGSPLRPSRPRPHCLRQARMRRPELPLGLRDHWAGRCGAVPEAYTVAVMDWKIELVAIPVTDV